MWPAASGVPQHLLGGSGLTVCRARAQGPRCPSREPGYRSPGRPRRKSSSHEGRDTKIQMLSRSLVLALVATIAGGCALGQRPTGDATGSPTTAIVVVAKDIAFQPSSLGLPSGAIVALTLENRDPGILHNVTILSAPGEVIFRGATFTGIASRTHVIAPLSSGEYRFACDVHPTMTGTITVR